MPVPVETTFHDSLERQLGMMEFEDERKEMIAQQIVGSIDEDGYLRRESGAIVDDLMFRTGEEVSKDEVESMITRIQLFDPPGIGARNLQECLIIQLKNKINKSDKEPSKAKTLALKILK